MTLNLVLGPGSGLGQGQQRWRAKKEHCEKTTQRESASDRNSGTGFLLCPSVGSRPQEFSSCPRDAADRLRAVTICRHLTPLTPPNWAVDERALDIEERSIDSSDLFATKVAEGAGQFLNERDSEYDEGEHNPFAVFLQDALAKATKSHEAPGSLG
jgi:hypothetical protein